MARKHIDSSRGLSCPPSRLRLVLADEQAIFRHGLQAILDAEPDLEVVGAASAMRDAIALSRRFMPDVMLTDIVFSNDIEVRALSQLRRECPGVRVLLLTDHHCQKCMRAAATAGIHRYILKHSPFEVLLRAIRAEGSDDERSEPAVRATGKPHGTAAHFVKPQIAAMTARERQVLIGIALGYSSKRIAGNLGRSVKTIEKHRFKMMHRLGLQNAAAATRYAMDNGLLHGDDGIEEPGLVHGPEPAKQGTAEADAWPEQTAHSQRPTRIPR
jgi:DNA-binding NarL/FixJ family response regulator